MYSCTLFFIFNPHPCTLVYIYYHFEQVYTSVQCTVSRCTPIPPQYPEARVESQGGTHPDSQHTPQRAARAH